MPGGRATTRSVLIVDDDVDVRETLFEAVAQTGRAVFSAKDPADALRLLDGPAIPRPCLVLLDRQMGATSGGDFLEALRARLDRDKFRVVSISASPRTPSAQEAGVVGFLRKPFDIAALEAVLDEHG